ncbi:MAG TPA: WHG domain-containing protein [Acetobacteraceae bacterium]|nr:WHG domain-containing protein [Acetobacteraceae bacterium]
MDVMRRAYHHGDLRRALLEAGIALAREGGPEAVVLREATRRAGVVPNAAYRHFASRDALLQAVRAAALAALAVAMEKELAHARKQSDVARASLRAIGVAYLRFAAREPGLFRTAFTIAGEPETAGEPGWAGRSGMNPFQLLGAALDQMVAAGALPAKRRPGAEYLAWSAVHGLAMLVLEGPLRRMTRKEIQEIGRRVVEMVEKGL